MHSKKHLVGIAVAALAVAALSAPAASAGPTGPYTEPVSVTPEGRAGGGASHNAVISRNGRYVFFTSEAENLDPAVAHGGMYIRDLRTGKVRFSGFGGVVAVLNDGRYAYTWADDVVLNDPRTGKEEKFGIEIPEGYEGLIGEVSISPNARYAVFTLQETGAGPVVFLRDRIAGTTERISQPKPTWEPRAAGSPTVSDDGRRIVYQYNYSNGPRGDDWGDIWMYDRTTRAYTQIDRSFDGSGTQRESLEPSISGDGRTVVFESADTHLVPGDTDGSWNVFVHTVATGANQRLQAPGDAPAHVYTRDPAVSADGRYVTFTGRVDGLPGGTRNPVHLRDLKKGTTVLVAPGPSGDPVSAQVEPGGIADGGRRVAFVSWDGTLIPGGDTNDERDVFVRHLR
ncbi:TolB family protein [Streptomyces sp. NPDC057253]|uniref:TolB family protein n=1 Tax=Streptomyces sp. NPDC057253 TaxID=3346069 RepID=UPI003635BBF3